MKIAHELHELREKKNKIIRVNSCNSWASIFHTSPGEGRRLHGNNSPVSFILLTGSLFPENKTKGQAKLMLYDQNARYCKKVLTILQYSAI